MDGGGSLALSMGLGIPQRDRASMGVGDIECGEDPQKMAVLSVVLEGLHTHTPNHNSRSGTPVPPHRGPPGGPRLLSMLLLCSYLGWSLGPCD